MIDLLTPSKINYLLVLTNLSEYIILKVLPDAAAHSEYEPLIRCDIWHRSFVLERMKPHQTININSDVSSIFKLMSKAWIPWYFMSGKTLDRID
jgi:hypothetical protein